MSSLSAIRVPEGEHKQRLKRTLTRERRRSTLIAWGFIAPLVLFMLLFFVAPLASLLGRAVWSPEVRDALPRTTVALSQWHKTALPPDETYLALAQDVEASGGVRVLGNMAQRLEYDLRGFRAVVQRSARAVAAAPPDALTHASAARALLIDADARWGDLAYWHVLARNASPWTASFVLAAVDLRQAPDGTISRVPENQAVYLTILGRTFWISAIVTLIALVLGYPMAYWLTTLSETRRGWVMICILIPFWSSVLVRVASWMVLLQREGVVNKMLMGSGVTSEPIDLLFNRLGVYISMVHILLPVMILPIYSVMRDIPKSYVRAAVSLGSHPFEAFWRVYVPHTVPGVTAGALLVFIMALGYYIAPGLLGGAGDQFLSYYVAYFTNQQVNWGLACALGAMLLISTALAFVVFRLLQRASLLLTR